MIRRIDHLRGFGIYRDFRWSGQPDFARRNLLYGWNYSGKTTLSRLFQILEKPERLAVWQGTEFEITCDNAVSITHRSLASAPKVRVFNRDFVKDSFLEEHTAPAVFILGPENVALRQRLNVLNARREQVRQYESARQNDAKRIQDEIDRIGTDKARDLGQLLGDRNFRRPNLQQRVEEVRANPAEHLLSDNDAHARIQTWQSSSGWNNLTPINPHLPDLGALSARVGAALSETASNRAIERLKADRNLESWVRSGMALHSNGGECGFCGSAIPAERLEQLRAHFSEAYEALVRQVTTLLQECESTRFELPAQDERDFAPTLRADFNRHRTDFQSWATWADALRRQIVAALTQKQTALETQMPWQADLTRAAEGREIVSRINTLIQQHNTLATEHQQTRQQAKVALERHHAAQFFRDNNIAPKETERVRHETRGEKARQTGIRIDAQVAEVNRQLQAQSIGAVRLNEVLRFLLRDSNIEVADLGNGRFEFRRDGHAASNMSEGEKTALTFAYFLTSLEASGATLADTIVFIDDPISSLDSNHIYAVYALIVERLKDCHQLFVSTHNSELLGLLKGEWFEVRQQFRNTTEACAYYVRRELGANSQWTSVIEDLPPLLRKYKSEYQFVFSQLHAFASNPAPSTHEAYTAPNLVRKFLEAYLGFRKPSVSKWSDKLDLLFDTPEERREIQKFADDASHLQSLTRALEQPDFVPSAQRCVRCVLTALQTRDREHHTSLCALIGPP
jgi:wobble nucleotide-excising tRNase